MDFFVTCSLHNGFFRVDIYESSYCTEQSMSLLILRMLRQKEVGWSKYGNLCLFLFFSKSIFSKITPWKKNLLEDNHWLTTQLSKTEHKLNYCTDISRPPRQKRDNWQKKEKSIKWLQKRLGARQSWGKRWFKFWTFFPTPNKLLTFFYHAQWHYRVRHGNWK